MRFRGQLDLRGANRPIEPTSCTAQSHFETFVFRHPSVIDMESEPRISVEIVEEHIVILILAIGQIQIQGISDIPGDDRAKTLTLTGFTEPVV